MRSPLTLLTLLAAAPALAQSPHDSLVARLRAVAAPVTLTPAGDLAGPGGERLAALAHGNLDQYVIERATGR